MNLPGAASPAPLMPLPEAVSLALDLVQEACLVVDAEWRLTAANAAAERLFSRPRPELLGRGLWDLFDRSARGPYYKGFRAAARSRSGTTMEVPHPAGGGRLGVRAVPSGGGLVLCLRELVGPQQATPAGPGRDTPGDGENWFRAAFERAAVGIAQVGLDGRWVWFNERLCQITGYPAGELSRKTFQDITHPDDLTADVEQARRLAAGRIESYSLDKRYLRKDGGVVWVNLSASAVRGADDRPLSFVSVVEDITPRKAAEAALRESEQRFREIYEHVPVGIAQVGLRTGQLLAVNPGLCRMLGHRATDLLGRTWFELTHPEDAARERKLVRQMIAGALDSYSIEKRYLHRDGSAVWVRTTSSVAKGAVGQPYRVSVVEDITDRRRAADALRDREARLGAILDTAADAILTIDEAGVVRSANPATERMLGYAEAELVGRNVSQIMPEPYRGEHDGYMRRYLKTGQARIIGIGREVTARRKDGTNLPVGLSVSEVPVGGGGRLFTGILHDLSGRRRLERQIVEASSDEQRRIGQDLHDGVCQDLLGVAFQADLAAGDLAARGAAEAAAVTALAAAVRDVASQVRRLSHGLNPVDLKAGGLPEALRRLADRVADAYRVRCRFVWDGAARVDDDATATHLYRLAQEAIGNAIKHGKAGRIAVRLSVAAGKLSLAVTDDGVGFTAVPPAAGKTGIGLHTMQYRANMIGGTFFIGPGRRGGTVVTCALPLAVAAGPKPAAARPKPAGLPGRSSSVGSSGRIRSAKPPSPR